MRLYLNAISLVIILFVTQTKIAISQEFVKSDEKVSNNIKYGFDPKKLFFGGGLGLQFGTETLIDISPQIGYRFTEKLNIGLGFTYLHFSSSQMPKFSTSIFGGNVFASYIVLENVFVRTEYEILSLESKFFNPNIYPEQDRFNVQSVLVGGGYRYPIGARSFLNMMILWNLNETIYTPYSNPIIRMNFEF
jgi:hypothetical protein